MTFVENIESSAILGHDSCGFPIEDYESMLRYSVFCGH